MKDHSYVNESPRHDRRRTTQTNKKRLHLVFALDQALYVVYGLPKNALYSSYAICNCAFASS